MAPGTSRPDPPLDDCAILLVRVPRVSVHGGLASVQCSVWHEQSAIEPSQQWQRLRWP